MNVALIANAAPWPPTNGATVRQYYLLREMAARKYKVAVFGYCESKHLEQAREKLKPFASEIYIIPKEDKPRVLAGALSALLRNAPLSEGFYASGYLSRSVKAYFHRFPDATSIVHSSNVARLVPVQHRRLSTLDMADVDSSKFAQYAAEGKGLMKLIYSREARVLSRLEARLVDEFGATVLVANKELAELKLHTAPQFNDKLFVVSNGVDLDYFQPATSANLDALPAQERRFFGPGRHLLFTGVMDYPPNVEAAQHFANEIFPALKAANPDLVFTILGSRPTGAVRALAQLPGVQVTGFVDSAVPYFARAEVVVIPLRLARGVQNKALEAMACGRPVVTYEGVAAGLGDESKDALLVARNEKEFSAQVQKLLADKDCSDELVRKGRRYVVEHHDWGALMSRLLLLHLPRQAHS
jgi:polysaccharide biosynthesis protein PslH